MEDIISKNIFKDKDLRQLSPDYVPKDILLRMEMRRSMAKDTHKHGIPRPCYWQSYRTAAEKSRDYIMNKEIVDIRNYYRNNNIKNHVILKHGGSSPKLKRLMNDNKLRLNDLDDSLEIYLSKSPNPIDELVVTNDDEFKLNIKPKAEKNVTESRKIKKYQEKCSEGADEHYEEEVDGLMRVECRYTYTSYNEIDDIDENRNYQLEGNKTNTVYTCRDFNESNTQHGTSEHANDLQTLLIMMAITNKTNENIGYNIVSPKSDSNVHGNNIITNTILYTSNTDTNFNDQPGDISNILNVTPLRIQINDKQMSILTKYVKMWKDYVNRRKDFMSQQRQAALDTFFDKLSKKKLNADPSSESAHKSKMLARDYSTYQHRYKVQKHIIALQKVKLEEQNRMIEELKYNKIIEASKQSVEDMKEQVRKTYYEIDRQLKPKIKCLTNELKIQEIEEPALVLHCLKVPQFLQRMEKRAREREEKHAMIRERRKQMEEERIRLKQQVELAKAEMDKEEKMKKIIELREKRKKERIEAIRKKQHVERLRALIVMADLHYERYLMISYGIRPLRKLLEIKRQNTEKAKAHYIFQLKKNVFLHLMWYTEDMCFERNYKAEDFYRKKILRKAFEAWKKVQQQYIAKKQVADDYYDLYVVQLVFRHFRRGIEIVKKENELKLQKAVIYYKSNLMFKIFTCWRTLPALNALKREQDARKARWRDKVLLVVPDYNPPDD